MSQAGKFIVIAVTFMMLGAALTMVLARCDKCAVVTAERQQISEIKSAVLQHVARATREFAPASDVDIVVETTDRQPDGRIMAVGFCRLVTPKPGGITGGRFWVEVYAKGKDGAYEVKDITSKYGMTEDGSPWAR